MLLFDEHSEELDIFLRKKKERKYTLCTLGRTVEEPQFDVGHVCKCNAFWQWSYATVILSSSWIRAMNTHTHTHTHTGIPPQPYPPWSPTHAARHKKTPDNASRRFSQLALQCDAECSVGCCEVRTQYCCITNTCPTNPAFGSTVPQAEKHSVCLSLSLSLSFSPVCVW